MIEKPERISDILENGVKKSPDSPALICGEETYSFDKIDEMSDRVAANLLRFGIARGDRIAVNAPNITEWIVSYLALAKIGAVTVALNVRYRETELDYMLNQSQTSGIISIGLLQSAFGDFDFVDYLGGLRHRFPGVKRFFFIGGTGDKGFDGAQAFDALTAPVGDDDRLALNAAKAAVTPDDPVMIIYTSGTTGKPKGALLTHKSQIASAWGQVVRTGIDENDRFVTALPMNHVAGITCAVMSCLIARSTLILQPVFIPAEYIELCQKHQVTMFGGVTTMVAFIFMDPAFSPEKVASVRLTLTGGSNVEPGLMQQIMKNLPDSRVMNLYGLSECSGAVVMSTDKDDPETLLQSIGKPLAGVEVTIVDEDRKALAPGEIGELMVTGDTVTAGYYNWPEATGEAFRPEGALTGDMGYVDGQGYVYLKGRKKEMYIQGGYNIYPAEIENLLTAHPKVAMAAGIGIPDDTMGEVGRYYIVTAGGTEVDETELSAYVKDHLANYKCPRQFVFVDDLPLTPAGKVKKSQLKSEYLDNIEQKEPSK